MAPFEQVVVRWQDATLESEKDELSDGTALWWASTLLEAEQADDGGCSLPHSVQVHALAFAFCGSRGMCVGADRQIVDHARC